MDVAVVYESIFGNTRIVAEAIAEGLQASDQRAQVAVMPVGEATPERLESVELLIVGAPTHVTRMPSPRTRQQFTAAPGVREWLAGLPAALPGQQAAAFDTRLSYPLAGSAARPISRRLRHHGYKIVAKPTGFIVEGGKGPLKDEERERARAWGAGLVREKVA
ncbi:MAG TPA: flavodoxin domain-containing protein [Acidimicrobiales bacterium]|nr:flavodoxin domain-containing protein [Acidimicrobiales bacterium]